MKSVLVAVSLLTLGALGGCAPEVGSEKWCAKMAETPKGDWSMNETRDYAKFCVLKIDKES